jgi:hypothetical protein
VKISFSSKTIKYFLLIVAVILFFMWILTRDKKTQNTTENQGEFVLPINFGVSDSGFEGKIKNFSALNAKALIDTREKIDGASSLKISFSDQSVASVKIPDYFDVVSEGNFYRLGFWAKGNSEKNKQASVRIINKERSQDLGKFSLGMGDAEYFEFYFQAKNDAQDLLFTSTDGIAGDVWIDDVSVEKIDVKSMEELKNILPTISGNTKWKNVDQYQDNGNGDSGDFLSISERKIGQIFQPSQNMFSGVAFEILRHGTGGSGNYQVQLREFDEKSGVISDNVIALAILDHTPSPKIADAIKNKEQQMRKEFAAKEQDIKEGKIPNDETDARYPSAFTQDQIDADKAAKRAAKLEIDIREMKNSFNAVERIDIPLAVKLDTVKKYWIGIDNVKAVVDRNNYISVITASSASEAEKDSVDAQNEISVEKLEIIGGFASESANSWKDFPALWFETFYPEHYAIGGNEILSGATISDMGEGKLIYRYRFLSNDITLFSGFSGRKIYDMADGSYDGNINSEGSYNLSDDDFVVYKFNTVYPVNKIIVRGVDFHQSLALEISSDGENWEEIYSDNPAEKLQSINSIVFNPEEKTAAFYLRIKPAGGSCVPLALFVEAELEK